MNRKSFYIVLLLNSMIIWVQIKAMMDSTDQLVAAVEAVKTTQNLHIGTIDRLMIERTILRDGYEQAKQNINEHVFKKDFVNEGMPHSHIKVPEPYVIQHLCINNDGSQLSTAVFHMIHKRKFNMRFIGKNEFNAKYGDNVIDHCTTCELSEDSSEEVNNDVCCPCLFSNTKDSDEVYCTSRFYNKIVLLKALETTRNQ